MPCPQKPCEPPYAQETQYRRQDETHDVTHDRQRPHRPGVAVAVAGRLPRGQGDVPLGARPDEGVPGLQVRRPVRPRSTPGSSRATRPCSPKSSSAWPKDAGRWPAAGGSSRTATSRAAKSFVRQGLYGQRYFQAKFGVLARVGFNVDSFGHAGTLPQILKKSGHRLLRLPAPAAAREGPALAPVLVGGRRRLARADLPHPVRVLCLGQGDLDATSGAAPTR